MHYLSRIRFLEGFSYLEGYQDKGTGVSEKAKSISELMNNQNKLEEERAKSKDLQKRLGLGESQYGNSDKIPKSKYSLGFEFGSNDDGNNYSQPSYVSCNDDGIDDKRDNIDKEREFSFQRDKEKSESANKNTHEEKIIQKPTEKHPPKAEKAIIKTNKKMEDDFDFIDNNPTQLEPKTNTGTTQLINLLDMESDAHQQDSNKPTKLSTANSNPVSSNFNLLDDITEAPRKEQKSFTPSIDFLESFKSEINPISVSLEEEKKKIVNTKAKQVQPAKSEQKINANDLWNQFQDIVNIGDLSEPKKLETKSINVNRKGCQLVLALRLCVAYTKASISLHSLTSLFCISCMIWWLNSESLFSQSSSGLYRSMLLGFSANCLSMSLISGK